MRAGSRQLTDLLSQTIGQPRVRANSGLCDLSTADDAMGGDWLAASMITLITVLLTWVYLHLGGPDLSNTSAQPHFIGIETSEFSLHSEFQLSSNYSPLARLMSNRDHHGHQKCVRQTRHAFLLQRDPSQRREGSQ